MKFRYVLFTILLASNFNSNICGEEPLSKTILEDKAFTLKVTEVVETRKSKEGRSRLRVGMELEKPTKAQAVRIEVSSAFDNTGISLLNSDFELNKEDLRLPKEENLNIQEFGVYLKGAQRDSKVLAEINGFLHINKDINNSKIVIEDVASDGEYITHDDLEKRKVKASLFDANSFGEKTGSKILFDALGFSKKTRNELEVEIVNLSYSLLIEKIKRIGSFSQLMVIDDPNRQIIQLRVFDKNGKPSLVRELSKGVYWIPEKNFTIHSIVFYFGGAETKIPFRLKNIPLP